MLGLMLLAVYYCVKEKKLEIEEVRSKSSLPLCLINKLIY